MKTSTSLIVFLLFSIAGMSQNFKCSEFEKSHWQDSLIPNEIYPLYFGPETNASEDDIKLAQEKLEIFYQKLEKKKIKEKPVEKQVKIIFNEFHKEFLQLYKENVFFSSLFKQGEYNCVTASMAYSIVFEQYNIPYQIIIEPTHVYLVADPEGQKITVETTDPANGFLYIPDKEKQAVVEMWIEGKFVKPEARNNYLQVYDSIMGANETIDQRELCGVLYSNKGYEFFEKELYQSAYNAFLKSEYFFEYESTTLNQIVSLSNIISLNQNRMDSTIIDYRVDLLKLYQGVDETISVSDDFKGTTHQILYIKSDTALFQYAYQEYLSISTDTTEINEIILAHSLAMYDVYINYDEFSQALYCVLEGYSVNPNHFFFNKTAENLLTAYFANNLTAEIQLTESMDQLKELYPDFVDSHNGGDLLAAALHTVVSTAVNLEDMEIMEESFALFEETYASTDTHIKLTPSEAAKTYYTAWQLYTRKRNEKAALAKVNKGLEIDPENRSLQRAKSYY